MIRYPVAVSARSVLACTLLSLAALAGCGAGSPSAEKTGGAFFELAAAPTNARCLAIQVVGTTTVRRSFDIAPQSPTVFRMNGLPLGEDVFSAQAFTVACAATAGVGPAWASDSVTATVTADVPVRVRLTMTPTAPPGGSGVITIDFPPVGASGTVSHVILGADTFPVVIGAGPDGNVWYGRNTGSTQIGRMAPDGSGRAEFTTPSAALFGNCLVTGPDGNLWYTDNFNSRVGRVTPAGAVTEFPLPAGATQPNCITAGTDGNLWISTASQVVRMTTSGETTQYTVGSYLAGIAAGSDGAVWYAKLLTPGTIGRVSGGGFVEYAPDAFASSQLFGIAAGPDGALWFTDVRGSIGRITVTGEATRFALPPDSFPGYITAGPDGNLWFAELYSGNVGRITPAGVVTEFPVTTPSPPASPGQTFRRRTLAGIAAGPDGNVWFAEPEAGSLGSIVP